MTRLDPAGVLAAFERAAAMRPLPILEPWFDDAECARRARAARRAAAPHEVAERMYPRRGGRLHEQAAKAVCAACPVRAECLEWALKDDGPEDFGIWGGTSPAERKKIRRDRKAAGEPELAEAV